MIRLYLLAAAIAVAGCGSIDCEDTNFTCTGDDRPATLEYVTSTILRPYCATAGCHSAFAFKGNPRLGSHYRFDTYEDARDSILIPVPDDPMSGAAVDTTGCDADSSLLYLVLTRPTVGLDARMPYDQALATADIALVKRWINEGLDGLGVDTSTCPPTVPTP